MKSRGLEASEMEAPLLIQLIMIMLDIVINIIALIVSITTAMNKLLLLLLGDGGPPSRVRTNNTCYWLFNHLHNPRTLISTSK